MREPSIKPVAHRPSKEGRRMSDGEETPLDARLMVELADRAISEVDAGPSRTGTFS